MNASRFLGSYSRHRFLRSMYRAAAVAAICLAAPLVAHADTFNYSFSGAEGHVEGNGFLDNCTQVIFSVTVSARGTHSISSPGTQPFGVVLFGLYNNCTQTGVFGSGSADLPQFSAPDVANGTQPPRSITASGQIPLQYVGAPPPPSQVLTFQLTLTPAGFATEYVDTFQSTLPVGATTITQHGHTDMTYSLASVSLIFSVPNLGTIMISPQQIHLAYVASSRSHTLTINTP